MENDSLPQYMQIALSIAGRIAGGDVPEGTKISGRSKLSSEYNVSPETIRKAVRLLSDMRVVDVREKSGVYVLSADNARRYLHNAGAKIDVFAKRQQMNLPAMLECAFKQGLRTAQFQPITGNKRSLLAAIQI